MNTSRADERRRRDEDRRPSCRYWKNCYQTNVSHRRKFKHPSPEKDNRVKEPAAKKRKSPDNGHSTANDAPQTKKQSTSPEEIQKTDEVQNPVKENTDKDSKSIEDKVDQDSKSIKDKADKDSKSIEDKADQDSKSIEDKANQGSKSIEDKADEDSKSIEEKADKDLVSTDEKTDKALDSNKEQNNEIVETPKVTPSAPNTVESSNNAVKDVKNEDLHVESAKLIRKIFLVSMPQDFYKFYDFCTEIKSSDPTTALKIADLKLVGPYDVLSGEITSDTLLANQDKLLAHWRYYYDPPEFQTIVKGNDKEGLHFGYWRDRPSSDPVFVATNSSNVSHKIKPTAENIFGAISNYIEERAKKANPFEKTSFFNLLGKLKAFAKKHNISLETQTAKMKSREKIVVARTIHGAGIVCPYNKKTQVGYRELSVTDNQLLKIVKKIEDAQNDEERAGPRAELGEVVRLATIAGDECDFGTCLELGHDLLSTGCTHVQNAALAVLSIAYSQLERTEFLKIVEAHMKDRKKTSNCSALPPRKLIELS